MNGTSKKIFGLVAVMALAGCVAEPEAETAAWPKKVEYGPIKAGGSEAPAQAEPPQAPQGDFTREVKIQICDSRPVIDASYAKLVEQSLANREPGSTASAPAVSEIVVTKSAPSREAEPEFVTLKIPGAKEATKPETILCPTGVAGVAPRYRVQAIDDAGTPAIDTTGVVRIEPMKIAIAKDGTQTLDDVVIVFEARAAAAAPAAGTRISARIDRLPRTSATPVPGAPPAAEAPLASFTLEGATIVAVEDVEELGVPVRKVKARATRLRATIVGLPSN